MPAIPGSYTAPLKTFVSTIGRTLKSSSIPASIETGAIRSKSLAPLEADVFIKEVATTPIAKAENAFNGIFTDFALPSRKLNISEFFDKGTFHIEIVRDGKKIPVKQAWHYNENEDTLKIVDLVSGKTLLETDSAYEYFDKLIDLQKLNQAGLINDHHFGLYLAEGLPAEKLDVILNAVKQKGNETLTSLLDKYKTGHKRFQAYEGAKTNWKDRKKLANEIEKLPLKQDIDVVRYAGWGYLDSIPLANGKNLGAEIRRLQETNASKEEIQRFLQSLGPIQNKDFLSTAISTTTQYFEQKPIMYNLHLPEGTKGVYLEDLLRDGLSHHYEAEFLVQKEQFINIRDIRFENGKVIIDASIIPTKISK